MSQVKPNENAGESNAVVGYCSGPDQASQAAAISRWAAVQGGRVVATFSDAERPGDGLIAAVRAATLRSASLAVTSFDRLSPEPVHVALLAALLRIVIVK